MPASPAGGAERLHLPQGEFAIAADPRRSITTILGSCVATCLYDPVLRLGGMNHFLLPDGRMGGAVSASYGAHAMELLINALIRAGSSRAQLRAKVFGGARVVEGLSDIGRQNALFVRDYLRREGVPIEGESLGGTRARRIEFWPASGRVRQRLHAAAVPLEVPPLPVPRSEVELF